MYFTTGLILITIAWIIQFYKTVIQKDKNINLYFLILYFVGVIFLVIGDLLINDLTGSVLNLITIILPVLILISLIKD
ncbi:hypothetical protein GCM10025860_22440 [Methanobacterium ferruginis]|nr:hypothetical protein GCM10025860_22440 [Methanobacterium ferruginis]